MLNNLLKDISAINGGKRCSEYNMLNIKEVKLRLGQGHVVNKKLHKLKLKWTKSKTTLNGRRWGLFRSNPLIIRCLLCSGWEVWLMQMET